MTQLLQKHLPGVIGIDATGSRCPGAYYDRSPEGTSGFSCRGTRRTTIEASARQALQAEHVQRLLHQVANKYQANHPAS